YCRETASLQKVFWASGHLVGLYERTGAPLFPFRQFRAGEAGARIFQRFEEPRRIDSHDAADKRSMATAPEKAFASGQERTANACGQKGCRPPTGSRYRGATMNTTRGIWLGLLGSLAAVTAASVPAAAQQQKPNILFIMGDDIGWMQPSIYHR